MNALQYIAATVEPNPLDPRTAWVSSIVRGIQVLGPVTRTPVHDRFGRRESLFAGGLNLILEFDSRGEINIVTRYKHAWLCRTRLKSNTDARGYAATVVDLVGAIKRCSTAQELYDYSLEHRGYKEMLNTLSAAHIKLLLPGKIVDPDGFPITATVEPSDRFTVFRAEVTKMFRWLLTTAKARADFDRYNSVWFELGNHSHINLELSEDEGELEIDFEFSVLGVFTVAEMLHSAVYKSRHNAAGQRALQACKDFLGSTFDGFQHEYRSIARAKHVTQEQFTAVQEKLRELIPHTAVTATVEPVRRTEADRIRSVLRPHVDHAYREPHHGIQGTKIVLKSGDLIFVTDKDIVSWVPKTVGIRDFPGVLVFASEVDEFLKALKALLETGRISGLRTLFTPMLQRFRATLTREATESGYRALLRR